MLQIEIATPQRALVPRWLWTWPCADEHGNYQLSLEEWRAQVQRFTGEPAPQREAKHYVSSISERLLADTHAILLRAVKPKPTSADRDAIAAHGLVIEQALADVIELNAKKGAGLAKARAARAENGTAAGRPKIPLMVRDPNGNGTLVYGYEAAATLMSLSNAKSLAVRMANAVKKTARPLITIGRANRAHDMWSIERIGTDPASSQEPCQKDENDGQRENR